MKPRHFTSIKTKIFVSYGFIILILIILASNLYYFTAYHAFLENYTTSSKQLSKIVSQQIDNHIQIVNDLQKKILESNDIRDYIFEGANQGDPAEDRAFQRMIYMITGYDMAFYHMNILDLEDNILIPFGARYDSFSYELTPEIKRTVVDPATALRGSRMIIAPGKGSLYKVDPDVATLSFVRSFPRYSDSLSDPKGIIEFQIDLRSIDQIIHDVLLSYDNKAESVYIYDENQDLVYPEQLSGTLKDFYIGLDTSGETNFKNPETGKSELITSYHSPNTGFTVLIVTPEASLLNDKMFFRNIGLLIAFVSLLLLITITYRLADSISLPIIKLKDSISKLQLDTISQESQYQPKSNLNELELLSSAYNHMQLRLKESLDDIVQARTLSIHSQIMALQAQMDSHFLYNPLTIISIIAEENDDLQASEMCLKLTRMLRYITEDYSMTTTFCGELEHARNYTDLMSIRFGDKIHFEYHSDPALDKLPIPRLIIQPLIENCVKYSRSDDHTLHVTIDSFIEDDFWFTRISDNGPGFTEESEHSIYQKIQKLDNESEYPQITINGMGVANIYLRLKLFYDNYFIFRIEHPEQGASILIGGKMNYEEN